MQSYRSVVRNDRIENRFLLLFVTEKFKVRSAGSEESAGLAFVCLLFGLSLVVPFSLTVEQSHTAGR